MLIKNYRKELLEKEKPKHQFHDKMSLKWITNNKFSDLKGIYKINSKFICEIERVKPWEIIDVSWFSNGLVRDGIHGFRHACRVAVHAVSLAINNYHSVSKKELESLVFAGLLHDCQRKNDNADFNHGKRTAVWLSKNKNIVPDYLDKFFLAIQFSISVHNDPYEQIVTHPAYKKFKFFVDILKTADALDRYRFPRSDWWISSEFISLQPSIQDMSFAFDLALKSEELFFEIKNNLKSVYMAWQYLKQKQGLKI